MSYEAPTNPAKAVADARAPDATVEKLQALARSPYSFVREYVAADPNVTPEILTDLVPSELVYLGNYGIASAIVHNPRTPAEALRAVSEHVGVARLDGARRENQGFEVLMIDLLTHPNCPSSLALSVLRAKIVRGVREMVAERTADGEVLKGLLSDPSDRVRSVASARLKREQTDAR